VQPSKIIKIILLTLLSASGAYSDVIFSNFGSTPPGYDTVDVGFAPDRSQICFMPGACFIQTNEFAVGFSIPTGSTFEFTGFEVPLNFLSNGITNVDFTLAEADATGRPGTPLETITVDGVATSSVVYTGNSVLQPILTSGNYWLEAAIASGDFGEAGWNFANGANDLGPVSGMSGPFGPGGWSFPGPEVQAAFEIDGFAVPEPSALALMGCVLGICALWRRTRSS
jgi:hypothetical protein